MINQKQRLRRIISGGQTGVDRGALEAAIAVGLDHGGSCPRGRLAEDGRVPEKFQLVELPSAKYAVRTEQNVIDSDGTLILYNRRFSAGTALTHRMTIKNDKPVFPFDLTRPSELDDVIEWLDEHEIVTLNCAGPRESSAPGIQRVSFGLCKELFAAALR